MNAILLIIPTVIALILGIKLFVSYKKPNNQNKYLAFYFLLFAIVLTAMCLISFSQDTNFQESSLVNLFTLLFYVAILAIPATFYLYIVFISDIDEHYQTSDNVLKHYYIPITLFIINLFSFFYLNKNEDTTSFIYTISENVMNYANFLALLFIFPILNIYYIYKTLRIYKQHNDKLEHVFSYKTGVSIKWMKHYIVGYIAFIAWIYFLQLGAGNLSLHIPIALFITAYLLFIGIKGSSQKKVYFREFPEQKILAHKAVDSFILEESSTGYSEIKEHIQQIIELEKPYLNSDLTIHAFAKQVGSNIKTVSMVLNNEFEQNFVTFINNYRIQEARELLLEESHTNYTIEAIAEMVGFNSKSAFNRAFKKFTNQTPSAYRKNN